ncbi:MAG TPA: hypothetical protein DIW47_02895 [Bacteroidetes bacterium]|nr:hypothetical protein [Bacteroidota bacterium]
MKRYRWLLLLLPLGLFIWIGAISTRTAGGEDDVMHHLFARYALQHPANLFDLWAKPLYVLFNIPFAQFGFIGTLVFNAVLACLSALLVWKSAEKLGLRFSWLGALLLLSAPVYFYCASSAVTEILFGFLLSWAIFEGSNKRYGLAAALVSFLPFVRSEGYGIILVFAFGFVALRAWKALPLLALGFVVYSIAGYAHFKDIFWVITHHPYHDASTIYGSGPIWHFVVRVKEIWGIPLYILWILGTVLFVWTGLSLFLKAEKRSEQFWVWLFFIFGSFFVFLLGHSIVWYRGMSASLGLTRVMAAVMPACALIGLYAVDRVFGKLNPKLKMFRHVLLALLSFAAIRGAFTQNRPPYHGDTEKEEIIKAGKWFLNSPYYAGKSRVFYFAPSVAVILKIDPFDPGQRGDLSEIAWNRDIPSGSIIFWDAHFGPNEAHVPIDTLFQRPELEMIYHQKPEVPASTLNGPEYEIYLFRKP